MIELSKPQTDNRELNLIQKVLEDGWLGHGKFVNEFETKLKSYLQTGNAAAVSSGTAALHLALESCDIGPGDEVIVPSLTFVASIQAILSVGAKPVFCEVSPENLNMDIADVRKKISENTKAIMPVHYCGISCEMNILLELAYDFNLRLIEDAAHAFGSDYKGRKIGSIGDITCFSFDPIKNLTCGEGGAVCSGDDEIISKVKLKRLLGIDKDSWQRINNGNDWHYGVSSKGYRYHMSNINAAIGLAQFEKLDKFIIRRKEIVDVYNKKFEALNGVKLLEWNLTETAPFIYVLRVLNGKRDEFYKFMLGKGIRCGINYIPNHKHTIFNTSQLLPVTDQLYEEIISLPLHTGLTESELDFIIECAFDYFN